MKENNFTEQENNYINEQNGYTDKSTNVFYETVASTRFVVAKPIKTSKSGYTFRFAKVGYESSATDFAKDLLENSKGFDIRIKWNKNDAVVVAKPVSADAELVITANDLGLAIELVRGLRTQEIENIYATKNRAKRVPTRKESLVERKVREMKRFIAGVAQESESTYPNFNGFVGEDRREDLSKAAESYNQPEGNTADL